MINQQLMELKIEKAVTPSQVKHFINFPHDLYAEDKNYVPELFISQKKLFDKAKNPFFKHANAELFMAKRGNKICGRIAVIRNGRHLNTAEPQTAFFGFFDVVNDYATAEMLMDTCRRWAIENGFQTLRGPVNFSTNDPCGLLVEGEDSPPVIMMTYHPAYYREFLERYGLIKKMDLLAYHLTPQSADEKYIRIKSTLEQRLRSRGIVIRKISMKNFKSEVAKIHFIYNKAWEHNWGFVPMSDEEFYFAAEDMKAVVDEDFAFIAEHNGNPIGFSLTIPNLNEILIRIKRGRLFPSGLFKLLYYKKKIRSVRVLTLGIIEGYRNTGIDACFYARNIESAIRKNISWAEASWILEDNGMMNRALKNIGGQVYKKYRIYDLALQQ